MAPAPRHTEAQEQPCVYGGAAGALALCNRGRLVRYCGANCQRSGWKARHRELCKGSEHAAPSTPRPPRDNGAQPRQVAAGAEGHQRWPVRCPPELLQGKPLPRLGSIASWQAQELLCEGQSFVAPAEGLLGRQMLRWDWAYLSQHLPAAEKYGVMLDEGSKKIVMSHTARNGQRHIDPSALSAGGDDQQGAGSDQPLNHSDQTRMTFKEFVEDAYRYRQTEKGKMPYFGIHLLWRNKPTDNGFLGKVDEEMSDDLFSANFDLIRDWQEANLLPLVQRFYLFAGLGGTLYHCHYDLQPNIHVQLTGRKRFIMFPPEEWPHLYPFPVHHDLDRRCQVDLDAPSSQEFPKWSKARGTVVELNPGDALYIPPFWWHHVQSISPETTSMAVWFFEKFPQSSSVDYGISSRTESLMLMRDVEEYIGRQFPDVSGEEDCSKARPVKASHVASFMRWLRPRLGLPATDAGTHADDAKLLGQLNAGPEVVEKSVLRLMQESPGINSASQARDQLRAFMDRRF